MAPRDADALHIDGARMMAILPGRSALAMRLARADGGLAREAGLGESPAKRCARREPGVRTMRVIGALGFRLQAIPIRRTPAGKAGKRNEPPVSGFLRQVPTSPSPTTNGGGQMIAHADDPSDSTDFRARAATV
jgi:hypothetical protein